MSSLEGVSFSISCIIFPSPHTTSMLPTEHTTLDTPRKAPEKAMSLFLVSYTVTVCMALASVETTARKPPAYPSWLLLPSKAYVAPLPSL
eukprot:CAMPEP_0114134350 /NCGR_PEP_ID=MMETSP0043_2-20121206/14106_1 /TAXON_ID=464988 /ORGANISM="Hemiselmis andersenii, Strain CCMP644" /LENGTH=89 /DNA_ID=CAMNT_0001227975 /DNA_START=541 /DNA_END=806 /DNA_ORIENTATION=+